MRIAELLNDIGEIDADDASQSALALGRSVSAPARSSSGNPDDERDVDMDEDEHSTSCPEDKKRPRDFGAVSSSSSFSVASTSTRPPMRKRSKSSMTRSASSLASPTAPLAPFSSLLRRAAETVTEDEAEQSLAPASSEHDKKRSTRELFPVATDADRRAKQRLIVKRCYYKKINTIKSLRDEVDALEESFRAALHERQAQDTAAAAAGALSAKDLRQRALYVESLDVKDALREENRRLRRLADEYYMKNQGRLRQLLDSNHKGLVLFTPAITEE